MPDMDFGVVLHAREFQDTFTITSVNKQVNDFGEIGVDAEITTKALGVVIPGKGNLRRLDDGSRVTAYIEVYTRVPLTTGIHSGDQAFRDADIVIWHGNKYTVVATEDYSRFGRGFVKASCDLLPYNQTA